MWLPKWKHARIAAAWFAGGVVTFAAGPVIGQFFVALATTHHLYDNPDGAVTTILSLWHGLASSSWFQWGGGLTVGFAAGAWLDAISGHQIRSQLDQSATIANTDPENASAEAIPITAPAPPVVWKTLPDFFQQDFPECFSGIGNVTITGEQGVAVIRGRVCYNLGLNAKFALFYINLGQAWALQHLAENIKKSIDQIGFNSVVAKSIEDNDYSRGEDAVFTGRVFIYSENLLSIEEMAEIMKQFRGAGVIAKFRSSDYVFQKNRSA